MAESSRSNFIWLAATGIALALVARELSRRRRHAWDFGGKIFLVTGGSRGLGLAVSRVLAREGARLALVARDLDELALAAGELRASGAEISIHPCDVTDRVAVEELVREVVDMHGGLDGIIHDAGVIQVGPLESMTLQDFREAMDVHYWSAVYLTLASLPYLRRREDTRIVNISSIGGAVAVPHMAPYVASKFALRGFSDALRAEVAKWGIRVTTVMPGLMRTGSAGHALFKGKHEREYSWFAALDSLPGISISAESAAEKIVAACREGEATLVLSLPAHVLMAAQALTPSAVAWAMERFDRALPDMEAGADAVHSWTGERGHGGWAPSIIALLGQHAARMYNES
jgi:NAD(P)-dependent dehydrogenase (short-subunit alcohol dehydrogenase family)